MLTTNLFLVDLQCVSVFHSELGVRVSRANDVGDAVRCGVVRTDSGLSCGCTLVPSNKKRTLWMLLPWRSQNASISFLRLVVRLILKKTSLLLSVTLMLRCSDWPWSSGFCRLLGDPLSDIVTAGVVERPRRMCEAMGVPFVRGCWPKAQLARKVVRSGG